MSLFLRALDLNVGPLEDGKDEDVESARCEAGGREMIEIPNVPPRVGSCPGDCGTVAFSTVVGLCGDLFELSLGGR